MLRCRLERSEGSDCRQRREKQVPRLRSGRHLHLPTNDPIGISRLRLTYLACALATIVVGLAVARAGPTSLRDKVGDALWAVMIFWWVGVIAPRSAAWLRGVAAVVICFTVEVSQLYHAPAIDALRQTTLGHLVLGNGFDAFDLMAYGVGVLAAMLLEGAVRRVRT